MRASRDLGRTFKCRYISPVEVRWIDQPPRLPVTMNDVKNRIVKQIQQNPATAMNWLLVLACIPLVWRITYSLLPASITEPYAYWDPSLLNTAVDNRLPRWRNMGYWDVSGPSSTTQLC